MRKILRKSGLPAGVSRSRLIIVLLVLIALLVLSLVGQAIRSANTNRTTATMVLQDYARLVADEYVRRAMGEIGYYGYYAYINGLRQQIVSDAGIQHDPVEASTGSLARYRFLIDPEHPYGKWSQPLETELQHFLWQRANVLLHSPPPESGLTIDHMYTAGEWRTVVFATLQEPVRVFGFEVDRDALAARLAQVFEDNTLLPQSLASGRITNDFVYLRLTDNGGSVLFESGAEPDPHLLVNKLIDDDYSGIFENYYIDTAINPMVAGSLVIGGLPSSGLPGLIITVLLTFGLLFAAVRQLNREHALMKLRSDFVSEVSHELRTPLTQIRMFTETLLHERFETSDDKRRALEIINRESQRLGHLVENVLRFSGRNGVEQTLNVVQGQPAPLIRRVVEEFRPLAESANNTIELDLDSEADARFDDDALRQILLNLLDNAVKYGPEGQRILVTLCNEPSAVRLAVCDQGPGVPAAEREKIWRNYHRLERERDSAIAGTGIGLAVVHDLVMRLGGSARVESAEEGGACFVVELPKQRS
jgi:signal transduction histidine kinase